MSVALTTTVHDIPRSLRKVVRGKRSLPLAVTLPLVLAMSLSLWAALIAATVAIVRLLV